jgi:predicted amidophosphoribosyltransferase
MSNICSICNKDLETLGEQGCEDCGQEYDPLAPEFNAELSFEDRPVDKYETLPDIMDVVHATLTNQEVEEYSDESDDNV